VFGAALDAARVTSGTRLVDAGCGAGLPVFGSEAHRCNPISQAAREPSVARESARFPGRTARCIVV
jgi:hypothetical protein